MYAVIIDELVFREDFPTISRPDQQKIIRAIRKKLTIAPDKYGDPLKGPLKGYWKLRVGPFRAIYQIHKQEVTVYVIMVGFRRDEEVYRAVLKRLRQ